MQTGFLGRNLHGSQMDSFFYSPHEAACAAASSLAARHRLRVGGAPEPGGHGSQDLSPDWPRIRTGLR
jgi:hypothetical protein